jgi:hypothetical protein
VAGAGPKQDPAERRHDGGVPDGKRGA